MPQNKKAFTAAGVGSGIMQFTGLAEEATFTANFKDTDLKSFIETVGANLNKTIIMGPGVQGK